VPRHVYVHVPFCARRCSYCDFSIAVRRVVPVDEYLGALDTELRLRAPQTPKTVDTIYFGGGTPSRLGGQGVARAIELVSRYFAPAVDAEITIEANPEDVTPDAAEAWRQAGVNRLSLGGQSFDAGALAWMHRTHGPEAIASAMEVARAADITNLSVDLIFALPAELRRNWQSDIEQLLKLNPSHISLYGLTIEAGTPLGRWVDSRITVEASEEGYAEQFLTAHSLLTEAGFEHYEVSNFARPTSKSRHNSAYWTAAPYAALGPSAHEFDGAARRWNLRHYAAWRDALSEGRDPGEGSETLSAENRVAEAVYLGLRTTNGLQTQSGDESVIAPWIREGWVTLTNETIRCTPTGWLRLDALAAALTHHRSR